MDTLPSESQYWHKIPLEKCCEAATKDGVRCTNVKPKGLRFCPRHQALRMKASEMVALLRTINDLWTQSTNLSKKAVQIRLEKFLKNYDKYDKERKL